MYCPSCGVAVTPGLTYCNHCGEKLSSAKSDCIIKSPEVRPETLIGAMVFAFVFGLGAITLLMGMMKAVLRLEVGVILAFALLSFLIMLSLEGVFIRLLLHRRRDAEEAGDTVLLKEQATRELDAAQARGLPESMPSVTEHTTARLTRSIASEHQNEEPSLIYFAHNNSFDRIRGCRLEHRRRSR